MGSGNWFSRNIANILIILGVIAMLLPLVLAFQWVMVKKMLPGDEEAVIRRTEELSQPEIAPQKVIVPQQEITPEPEPGVEEKPVVDIETTEVAQETPDTGKKEPFKRENYVRGMMSIRIPRIDVLSSVMEGTTVSHLKLGPGLYDISPLPDVEEGNVCIAGHRTTYGAWFRNVDQLQEGDDIILNFNGYEYQYKVEKVFIVDKKDWSVTEATGSSCLTLTACHPPRSAKQRIVVRANLVHSEPWKDDSEGTKDSSEKRMGGPEEMSGMPDKGA